MHDEAAAALPPDLQDLIDVWLEIERETDALLDPLDDEQFNWSPRAGTWSIAQCFDHLNTVNRAYLEALKTAAARARAAGSVRQGPIRPTWFGRRVIAFMEPPPRVRIPIPRRFHPRGRKLKAEVWPEFVRQHGQLRSLVCRECPQIDLNLARVPSPFAPVIRMRVGTMLCLIAAHDRRHLWQAERLRQLPGFPRS